MLNGDTSMNTGYREGAEFANNGFTRGMIIMPSVGASWRGKRVYLW